MTDANEYEMINFPGKVHLINNDQDLAAISAELGLAKILGFDTETRPAFKKGQFYNVALIQLATDENAYLIRLQGITQFQILKEVFENPDIIKVGAAIRDDLKQLKKTFEFNPQNFIELQMVAKTKGLQNFGLKGMTEEVLKARLSKRAKTSNWEAHTLTDQQLMYAATDAWVGLRLYNTLNAEKADVLHEA